MNKDVKIFVAGHHGLVGSSVVRSLEKHGYANVITRGRDGLDLRDFSAVGRFFSESKPDVVIDAAAKVGGILANDTYPADFIRDNLLIQTNLIENSYRSGVNKFVFLGSSCIYPRLATQPIGEDQLLTGPLEPTNEWYAIAKIAGIKMCQAYRRQFGFDAISLMPTNLYGPGDNFDLQNSHVLPALMRRIHEAKERGDATVTVWGSGTPRREFLYVDDLADAIVFLMENYSDEGIINVGTGDDCSIRELAELIQQQVGFTGELAFDTAKPDGTPRKLLDVSKLTAMGWRARTSLPSGMRATYAWFLSHQASLRRS